MRTDLPPLAGEEHVCESCPFSFASHDVDRAAAVIAEVPARARQLFGSLDDAAVRRREDGVWSAVEYLCHLRDGHLRGGQTAHRRGDGRYQRALPGDGGTVGDHADPVQRAGREGLTCIVIPDGV